MSTRHACRNVGEAYVVDIDSPPKRRDIVEFDHGLSAACIRAQVNRPSAPVAISGRSEAVINIKRVKYRLSEGGQLGTAFPEQTRVVIAAIGRDQHFQRIGKVNISGEVRWRIAMIIIG